MQRFSPWRPIVPGNLIPVQLNAKECSGVESVPRKFARIARFYADPVTAKILVEFHDACNWPLRNPPTNTPNMTSIFPGQPHDRSALVLYGSETGNSQDVAEELGRLAERVRFVARVSEMDAVEMVCRLKSPDPGLAPVLISSATEFAIKIYGCHLRNLNNGSRRVPEECACIVEKSVAEAFASWMSRSRVVYHIWAWR